MENMQAPAGGPDEPVATSSVYERLNDKQRLFVDFYCQYRNASRAAREAGYAGGRANQSGYQVLTNSDVSTAIGERMRLLAMGPAEVLGRMSEYARGTMAYFLTDEGELTLTSELAQDNRHLLKKVRQKHTRRTVMSNGAPEIIEEVQTEIELYDAMSAVGKMVDIHGMVTIKHEFSGPNGGPIQTESRQRTWIVQDHTGGKPVPAPDEL